MAPPRGTAAYASRRGSGSSASTTEQRKAGAKAGGKGKPTAPPKPAQPASHSAARPAQQPGKQAGSPRPAPQPQGPLPARLQPVDFTTLAASVAELLAGWVPAKVEQVLRGRGAAHAS